MTLAKLMSNYVPHQRLDVITYSCLNSVVLCWYMFKKPTEFYTTDDVNGDVVE